MYRLDAGYQNPLHSHRLAQLDVVVSGRGTHRAVVARVRNGRATQEVRAGLVAPGECYYVPPHMPHEFVVDGTGPIVLLEVMLAPRHAHEESPFVGRPVPTRGARWVREGSRGARKLTIARTEEAEFAYYELPVGFHGSRHAHASMQAGVCLAGESLHRMELSVRQGRRTLRQSTDLTMTPGDCYFIPGGVPHESWVVGDRPALMLDVELLAPRRPRKR